jgi:hypothetical protein
MTRGLVTGAIALALLGAPAAALASDEVGGCGAAGEASGASAAARGPGLAGSSLPVRNSLASSGRYVTMRAECMPPSSRKLAATGERLAAGRAAKISGPALTYRTSRRGPMLEVAALGGGALDDVPFLAHLGLGWKF